MTVDQKKKENNISIIAATSPIMTITNRHYSVLNLLTTR